MGRILNFIGGVWEDLVLIAPYVITFIVLFFLAKNIIAVRLEKGAWSLDCFAIGCFKTIKEFVEVLKMAVKALGAAAEKAGEAEARRREEEKQNGLKDKEKE